MTKTAAKSNIPGSFPTITQKPSYVIANEAATKHRTEN